MKWNLFIYTYIHIYIYNKVIFQNTKLITVQNKSQRDRVRYFQMAMDKDSWRWGVGGGEGRGRARTVPRERRAGHSLAAQG